MSSLKPSRIKAPSRIPRPVTSKTKSSAVNADVLSPSMATPLKSTRSSTKESSAAAQLSILRRTTSESKSDLSESGSVKRGERDLKLEDRIVYVMEMESKMDQLRTMLRTSDIEKVELVIQLEEERRKVEDLQFCVEEVSITKQELEIQSKLEHARIKDLEQSLLLEKTRADMYQRQLEDTKVAIVSERSRVTELEKQLTMTTKEVADLRQKLVECSNQTSDVDMSISLLQEISSLQEILPH